MVLVAAEEAADRLMTELLRERAHEELWVSQAACRCALGPGRQSGRVGRVDTCTEWECFVERALVRCQ